MTLESVLAGAEPLWSRPIPRAFLLVSPTSWIVLLALAVSCAIVYRQRSRLVKHIDRIPGPAALPLLGNSLQWLVDRDEMFNVITGARKLYGRRQGFNRVWAGLKPYVLISKATVAEKILSSSKNIEKGRDYDLLKPWIGTGLLTSHAAKWHQRRKLLTPTFHFKILANFVEVFNKQSAVLVRQLAKQLDNRDGFDCTIYATLTSLDIICETAMGFPIHALEQSDSEYVKAHEKIAEIILDRLQKFWLRPDFIFRFTKAYAEHERCLKVLHDFAYRMISERREMYRERKRNAERPEVDDTVEMVGKKQLAFLDLLLELSEDGQLLTDADIREEVDTFILGGHDTTATALGWILYLLGTEPAVQERVHAEIDTIMGGDRERFPTMQELNEMKYLECCIKESLRLFPSIPMLSRSLVTSVDVDGYHIPAGTNAVIMLYQLHRDPEYFPNPEKFYPDRFLPENSVGRHPYAFIPFSAGPRNCIGQKFGALEEKAVLSAVVRHYRIEAVHRREDLVLYGDLVMRTKEGLKIRIYKRD
ncbi:AGAP010414-PA-like protein [Anopheles sinensis]|uniref:AGAP010414-PA-like protein n=1 Tax=Anopheles sinensis TaxID=74873 RepID=A0A084WPX1_ANOSI|nr:AGAP010414-PA-like protein [Anopheles sinensis]